MIYLYIYTHMNTYNYKYTYTHIDIYIYIHCLRDIVTFSHRTTSVSARIIRLRRQKPCRQRITSMSPSAFRLVDITTMGIGNSLIVQLHITGFFLWILVCYKYPYIYIYIRVQIGFILQYLIKPL